MPVRPWLPCGSDGKGCACSAGDLGDPCVRKIPWSREWLPPAVLLPGEFHGQRSLVGYHPWGCEESDTTEWLNTFFIMSLWVDCVAQIPYSQKHLVLSFSIQFYWKLMTDSLYSSILIFQVHRCWCNLWSTFFLVSLFILSSVSCVYKAHSFIVPHS